MVFKRLDDGTIVSRVKKIPDVVKVRLNEEDKKLLAECKYFLEQPKDSTALKQLALLGANVVLDEKMANIMHIVFENKRKNKRWGYDAEYE